MKKHLLSYLKKNLIVRCDNCRKYFSISAKIDFVALFLGKEEKDDPKRCMICGIPKTVLDEKSCHEEENGFFCSYCRQKIIGGKKECPSLS